MLNNYPSYERFDNRWRGEWNNVHPAAKSKDKLPRTELIHDDAQMSLAKHPNTFLNTAGGMVTKGKQPKIDYSHCKRTCMYKKNSCLA